MVCLKCEIKKYTYCELGYSVFMTDVHVLTFNEQINGIPLGYVK